MAHPPKLPDIWAAPPMDNGDGSWTFHARILSVTDGDTGWVWVLNDEGFGRMGVHPENIRLARINAPEKNRRISAVAGRASWVWAQENFRVGDAVYLTTRYDETFARLVGEIDHKESGLNWSDAIVAAGHAIYQEY